jgi:hypothetical protein
MVIMNDYYNILRLYKKFTDGTNYLCRQMIKGIDITNEKARFIHEVVNPMDALWIEVSRDVKEKLLTKLNVDGG